MERALFPPKDGRTVLSIVRRARCSQVTKKQSVGRATDLLHTGVTIEMEAVDTIVFLAQQRHRTLGNDVGSSAEENQPVKPQSTKVGKKWA